MRVTGAYCRGPWFGRSAIWAIVALGALSLNTEARANVALLASYHFDEASPGQEANTSPFFVPAGTNRSIVFSYGLRTVNYLFINNDIQASWVRLNGDTNLPFNILQQPPVQAFADSNFVNSMSSIYLDDSLPAANYFIRFRLNGNIGERKAIHVWVFGNVDPSYTPVSTAGTGNPGSPATLSAGALPGGPGFFAVDAVSYRQHLQSPTAFMPLLKNVNLAVSTNRDVQNRGAWINNPPADADYTYTFPGANESGFPFTPLNQYAFAAAQFRMAYRLVVNAGTGGIAGVGAAVGPTSANFLFNESPVIVAQANPGYRFGNWTGPVSNDEAAATSILPTNAPTTVTANFVKTWTLNVTGTPLAGGTVTPSGSSTQDENTAVPISATSNFGYVFDSWSGAPVADASAASTTVSMTSDVNLVASFVPVNFTVNFNLDNKGTRIGGGDLVQSVPFQTAAIAPEVQADPPWVFTGWNTSFNSVTSNLTVVAQYTPATFEVTFDLDNKGTRTGGGDLLQVVNYGDAALAPTVVPDPDWVFTGWDVAFNNITADLTVTAQYSLIEFEVTFDLDNKGTRIGGGALIQSVPLQGAAVAPVVEADPAWVFTGWDVAFDNITGDLTVTAQYAVASFTVDFDLDGKGTRTGGGALSQTVDFGDGAVAPVVEADPAWVFTGWDVAFDNITGDLTVTAQYAVASFTVTFDLDGKGTRTGGGALSQTVDFGDGAVAPVVQADPAWIFTGWDVAFDNITANVTVTAQYDPKPAPPSAITIVPATTGPTAAQTVAFTVEFDTDVVNFADQSDVVIVHAGTASTGVTISGGPSLYTVQVEGISGDGSFTLAVNVGSNVEDLFGSGLASSVTSAAVTIDNTGPVFSGLNVNPSTVSEGQVVFIAFQSNEAIAGNPDVLVNGVAASGPMKTAENFVYSYTVGPTDPTGPATVSISGLDLAGNPGSLSVPEAFTILGPGEALPAPGGFALLVLTGLLALGAGLRLHRRRA